MATVETRTDRQLSGQAIPGHAEPSARGAAGWDLAPGPSAAGFAGGLVPLPQRRAGLRAGCPMLEGGAVAGGAAGGIRGRGVSGRES